MNISKEDLLKIASSDLDLGYLNPPDVEKHKNEYITWQFIHENGLVRDDNYHVQNVIVYYEYFNWYMHKFRNLKTSKTYKYGKRPALMGPLLFYKQFNKYFPKTKHYRFCIQELGYPIHNPDEAKFSDMIGKRMRALEFIKNREYKPFLKIKLKKKKPSKSSKKMTV